MDALGSLRGMGVVAGVVMAFGCAAGSENGSGVSDGAAAEAGAEAGGNVGTGSGSGSGATEGGNVDGGSGSGGGADAASASGSESGSEGGAPPASAHGKRVIAYFAEWAVYGRNFHVPDVDGSLITHLNYAFANVDSTGQCALGDSYADTDKFYPGDTWDPGALRGSFHQLQLLKAKYPKLKTLLSIGGWTWSTNFPMAAASDASRATFAKSCVALALKYGFDGVDIDWEYPGGGGLSGGVASDAANYPRLLAAVRAELDARGAGKLLTVAAPSDPLKITRLDVPAIARVVDSINVMTYDFHGGWEMQTGFNSPLHRAAGDVSPTGWVTDESIATWLKAGAPSEKLVVGAAFYGRGWNGVPSTNGGLFQPATGLPTGTWENGVFDYKDLAVNYVPKMTRTLSADAMVPYLYDATNKVFITYDDAASLGARVSWIASQDLGGVMAWELSGDDSGHTLGKVLAGLM